MAHLVKRHFVLPVGKVHRAVHPEGVYPVRVCQTGNRLKLRDGLARVGIDHRAMDAE